jgi:REase_MTES_1575
MPFTRSELERRFLDLCAEAGLATPSLNLWIEGHEVDAVWEEQRVVVELDGHEFHGTRAAFERDRARDAALQVAGYRVLRITARRLVSQPAAIIADLGALLRAQRRSSRGGSSPPPGGQLPNQLSRAPSRVITVPEKKSPAGEAR